MLSGSKHVSISSFTSSCMHNAPLFFYMGKSGAGHWGHLPARLLISFHFISHLFIGGKIKYTIKITS